MPRKSANQVAIEGVAERVGAAVPWSHERPDPPADMPEGQAAIWRAVVSAMRPGWFSRETHEQLARYCHAMVECARLEVELARVGVESEDYDQLSKRRNATAASALSYARALRITPHSNKYNLKTGRDPARSLSPRPWERGDGGDEPLRRPWEVDGREVNDS
jgi:hypothetical protein